VNDRLGHGVGDRVLRAVGERLRCCVRSTDTVARVGGDEFAVVLEGDIDTPEIVGERILAALRHPFVVDGRRLFVGASLGLAEPGPGEVGVSADVLVHRADSAMYAGKRRGKGVAVRFGPHLLAELEAAESRQWPWPPSPRAEWPPDRRLGTPTHR
jgi:diguanylate cyclase (GGDEF)-like protein